MKIEANWLKGSIAQELLLSFEKAGYQTLFVGGCVRNALLGFPISDLDVATAALPHQSTRIAQAAGFRVVPTGEDHGTVTAVKEGQSFEITSFRKDVETFGRRAVVSFSTDIKDDALRRDFTMNALYVDRNGKVIDPLNGLADLLARRVRFIENPEDRIKEDFLRILRFFRFHAWYADQHAGMDADALSAIAQNTDGLTNISKERIGAEMQKLLSALAPQTSVCAMEQTGVLARVLPGSTSKHLGIVVHFEETLGLDADWVRRLLSLGAEQVKENLRLSNLVSKRIEAYHSALDTGSGLAELSYRFGRSTALDVALNMSAALEAPLPEDLLSEIDRGANSEFPVSASDLMPRYSGPALGQELNRLKNRWIASSFALTKSDLLHL